MQPILSDFLTDVATLRTAREVAGRFVRFGLDMGAVSVHTFFGTAVPEQFVSTYPDWWIPMQSEGNKMFRQHQIQIVRLGPPILLWGLEICLDNPRATPEGIRRSQESFSFFRQRSSVVFPTPDVDGTFRGGGLSLGFEDRKDSFLKFMADHGEMLALAARVTDARVSAFRLQQGLDPSPLSRREREVLLLLAGGSRVAAIADRLSLSNSAVNLYLANARRKLAARTREEAVAKAVVRGWIVL